MEDKFLQLTIDLTDVQMRILGSSQRVLACIRDDEVQILGELLYAVDNRLHLECVITCEDPSSDELGAVVAEFIGEINSCGFSTRVVSTNLSNSFLIIDDALVVFTEGGVEHQSTQIKESVDPCLRLFEELQGKPDVFEELFRDKEFIQGSEESQSEFEERVRPKFSHAQTLDDLLIKELAREPSALYKLEPRKFEELVARVVESNGYNVELTPCTRDGGRDIVAKRNDWAGNELLLIECKRYSETHRVQVGVVRALYGVIEDAQATRGLIVTTSFFTKGAIQFADRHKHQLALHDYTKLVEGLRKLSSGKTKGG